MLDLNDFFHFVQIVDRGGFAAAGRSLGVPKSTLSHRIQRLEGSLGVRLINRTSRQFSLTDVGSEFYRHALSMLQQAEAAEDAVRQRLSEPSGTIRFATSTGIAQFAMQEMVPNFILRFPKVNIVLQASNNFVDIVGENYDLAIRGHFNPLPDSALVQRALTQVSWYLFASPGYLDKAGTPHTPDELAGHGSLLFMSMCVAPAWHLSHPAKGGLRISIKQRLLSDDIFTLKRSACAGVGIVALPSHACRTELQNGSLKRVLPEWSAGQSTLTALIPFRNGMLPSVRAFVDFISIEFPKAVAL